LSFTARPHGRNQNPPRLITTNLDYAEWAHFLGNKALVDALLSRLCHPHGEDRRPVAPRTERLSRPRRTARSLRSATVIAGSRAFRLPLCHCITDHRRDRDHRVARFW
jgi:hypothetical protein